MKYITFAIMAALILGVAASPAFSNGFAFADEPVEAPESIEESIVESEVPEESAVGTIPIPCQPDCSKIELKARQSDASKQDKVEQRAAEGAREESGARLNSADKDEVRQVQYSTAELKDEQSDASKQDKVEQRDGAIQLVSASGAQLNSEDKDTDGPTSSERHGRR